MHGLPSLQLGSAGLPGSQAHAQVLLQPLPNQFGNDSIGFTVIDSRANFVFASPPDQNGKRIYDALYARKILVRYFSDPLLAHGMRITIGTDAEMDATLAALGEIG